MQHRSDPGPSFRGGGPGPSVQQRSAPRSVERGESQPRFRGGDGGSRRAQQSREEKAPRAYRDAQPQRAEKPEKADKADKADRDAKRAAEQAQERARTAKDAAKERSSSSEGKAAGESGRAAEKAAEKAEKDKAAQKAEKDKVEKADKKAAERLEERTKEGKTADRKEDVKRIEDAKRVALSGDKRERVQAAFREKRGDAKHLKHADFDFRVGKRLPRHWHFFPVPIAVIDIVPEYRDYVYVYVEDEYVICDPYTYEVVTIIPASGGRYYAGGDSSGRCTERISLDENERDLIVEAIERESRENRIDVPHLSVGWNVPRDIELLAFPDRVISRVGELSSCRYFVAEDEIAIVNPDEEKVVLLIDRT